MQEEHKSSINPGNVSGSERHYLFNLFMQAPAMIAILKGPDHVFELANPGYMQLVGKGRDIIGKPLREALAEIPDQGFIELLDEAYRTGKPYTGYETPARLDRNLNGTMEEVYLNFIYQPTRDRNGNVDGIFVHVVDVTEHVITRLRSQESEDKYRALFNKMDQGFCIFEMIFDEQSKPIDYRFLETNPVFENLTGLKDPIGKTARELVPNLETHWFDTYGRVATTGEPERFVEGSEAMGRWFEVSAFPIGRDSKRVALLFSDITERKKEDNLRKQLMQELETRVEERTRQLNSVNTSLQKSNEDLLQFAHVASHDLKEPVRKIKTFADMLGKDEQTILSERAKTYLEKINNASERMVSMIDGVLRYSAIDSYGQRVEPINLARVIKTIASDLEIIVDEKKAEIRYSDLPEIEGAPILIFQLFYNLIYNSLKFSKHNEPPVIEIQGEEKQSAISPYIHIILRDNGIGFKPEFSEQIFTTFIRLNSKDKFEGTGLGLSLCRKITHRHHGKIWARGEENKGAEFHIQLPLKQERPVV
jgi:PAS domain S-box-containing protein